MFNAKDRLPLVQAMILAATEQERKEAVSKLLPLQKADFKEIFRAMQDLPVNVRLLDLPLHEFLPRIEDLLVDVTKLRLTGGNPDILRNKEMVLQRAQSLSEHNPMLGHRGCRLSVTFPEIYEMQTEAIFQAASELATENVKFGLEIMIPLVGHENELKSLRSIVERTAQRVMTQLSFKFDYEIGTMIEVPRAALTAYEVAQHADFFSFGTNDLTQTTFAFSRDDAEGKFIQEYLKQRILAENPFEVLDREGVGKLMMLAVEQGRKAKPDLKIGICGEHGGEPSSIEFCHMLRLDYVSCSPFRVPIARLVAGQAKLEEKTGVHDN